MLKCFNLKNNKILCVDRAIGHISKCTSNAQGLSRAVKANRFVSYFFSGPHSYSSSVLRSCTWVKGRLLQIIKGKQIGGLRLKTMERNRMCENSSILLSSSVDVEKIPSSGQPSWLAYRLRHCHFQKLTRFSKHSLIT